MRCTPLFVLLAACDVIEPVTPPDPPDPPPDGRPIGEWWTGGPYEGTVHDVVTHEGAVLVWEDTALQRTSDDGLSWIRNVPPVVVADWALDPPSIYIAGGSLWRSPDLGDTWEPLAAPGDVTSVLVDPADPQHLIVGVNEPNDASVNRLCSSFDRGVSFATPCFELPQSTPVLRLDSDAASGHLYALTNVGQRLWRSTDRGTSWQDVSETMTSAPENGSRINSYAVSAADPDVILAGRGVFGGSLFVTQDSGVVWTPLALGLEGVLPNEELGAVAIDGASMFAAPRQALARSDNAGTSWTNLTASFARDLGFLPAFTLSINARGGVVYAGLDAHGVVHSADNGASWRAFGPPARLPVSLLETSAGGFVRAVAENGLYESRDRGESWRLVVDTRRTVAITAVAATDRLYYAVNNRGLSFILRDAASWRAGPPVRRIVPDATDPDLVTVAIGRPATVSRLLLAPGEAMATRVEDLFLDEDVFDFSVLGDDMCIVAAGHVYRGRPGAWSPVLTLEQLPTAFAASAPRFAVGTEAGLVFVSDDGCATWRPHSTASTVVTALAFLGSRLYVAAGPAPLAGDTGLESPPDAPFIWSLTAAGSRLIAGTQDHGAQVYDLGAVP